MAGSGAVDSRRVISFHYTLRDPRGEVIDTNAGGDPVSFLEGAGQIIEGLEEVLVGLAVGAKERVEVPAARAYGERDPEQMQAVLRDLLPVEGELQPGDRFQAGNDPHAPTLTVMRIEGDQVWLDANHPLAGVDLSFDVEVVAVRAATAAELGG